MKAGVYFLCIGPAKKTRVPDEETNQLTAYHEAGHTLVAMFTKDATALNKVTIIPRGGALGHVSFLVYFFYLYVNNHLDCNVHMLYLQALLGCTPLPLSEVLTLLPLF